MSSYLDYKNRLIDVMAFQGAKGSGEVLLEQALAGEGQSGMVCTGTQKLTQRWILEFLTDSPTMIYLPERGSGFIAQLRQGNLHTELDVIQAFGIARADIRRNLLAEEDDAMPNDERYEDSELLGLVIQPGFLELNVRLTSLAGTQRAVILPIPIIP